MKLHNYRKADQNVRRCLSILLVLCIVFTSGSPNQVSAADTEGHRHDESCYEERSVCEKEEHTEDCYEERRTLICMNEGEDGHEHTDDCYETERILVCGMEEHVSEHYERILVCGRTEGDPAEDDDMPVIQSEPATDTEADPEISAGETVPDPETEETEPVTETDVDRDQPDSGSEEGSNPDSEEESGTGENSGSEEEPGQSPEGDPDMDADGGEEQPDASETDPEQPAVPDEDQWMLICEEEHDHTEDCYREITCGLKRHKHTEECYDEGVNAACTAKEHEHTEICLLSVEDRQRIKELNELIAAVPGAEALEEMQAGYEAGEVSEDEYAAFLEGLEEQVKAAYEAYMALDEELRQYAEGIDGLLEVAEILEAMKSAREDQEPFAGEYSDDKVIIRVAAEPGVLPKGAVLAVREVVQQDAAAAVGELASEDPETSEPEELNAEYEEVRKELEASVAEDDTKEIAGFLAYDISFLLTDADGETREIEPEGNVSVSMDFVEAYLPERIADSEGLEIDSVEVVHMKEVENAETGETSLQAEVLEEAQVSTTETAELEKAVFVVDDFSIFTLSWKARSTRETVAMDDAAFTISWTTMDKFNAKNPSPSKPLTLNLSAFCVDDTGRKLDLTGRRIGDVEITGAESNTNERGQLNLGAQAPYFSGYVLERIVLGDPVTGEMSDVQIAAISAVNVGSDKKGWEKALRWKPGEWDGGIWTEPPDATNQKWDSRIAAVYFVYKELKVQSIPPDPEHEKVPKHEKYIKYNQGNDYTLTLNVTGERETQDIDILLIVDTSQSMINLNGVSDEGQRYNIVNNALQKLNEDLKKVAEDNDQLKINVGIVSFDGGSGGGRDRETNALEDVRDWYYLGSDGDPDARVEADWKTISETAGFDFQLTRQMIEARAGSTNWQAAFRTGEKMLANRPSSNRKYVIFLTDGDPTTRYASGSSTITVGSGCATHNLGEGKYGDPYNYNFEAAVNEWKMSPVLQSSAQTFVIAVLDEKKVQTDKATEAIDVICGNLASSIGATKYSGQDQAKLNEIFDGIVSQIQYSSFKDVEIHDTLSEYVEFLEAEPTFTVTSHSETDPDPKPLVDKNGNPLYEVTCDKETKTIVLKVLKGGELEDGVTYSISFHVKPTEKAVREFIESGYPHVGEPTTDAPDNDTSSGKPGFHSNCEERADLYYNYNQNGVKTTTYLQPVVQVHKPEPDDAGITKTMGKADAENRYPITIQIKCGMISDNTFTGSTGDGWTVFDSMAPYTNFLSLAGGEMNGHQLILSEDGKSLTTELNGESVLVAVYMDKDTDMEMETYSEPEGRGLIGSGLKPGSGGQMSTGQIIWHLDSKLAEVVLDGSGKGYCSYSLTYYVDFSDSGTTEIRNTNTTTYIQIPGDGGSGKYLYPEKMPFFVNVVGNKKSAADVQDSMQGAVFHVYRDAGKEKPLALHVESDENGHFAFQLGQSDLCDQDLENGSVTVYLEEAEAPEGYERDTVLHPITVQVSNVDYMDAAKEKANPGIWDISPDGDWGSVTAGSAAVRHDSHEASPDFLNIDPDAESLVLEYYNTKPWRIRKTSASNPDIALAGAEFALYRVTDDGEPTLAYTGTSDAEGFIGSWISAGNSESISSAFLAEGTYELRETKAPAGYALSGEIWLVEVSRQGKVSISLKGGASLPGEDGIYPFRDEVLYTLPSAGGIGIYWYLVGGTLLMMASALILYRCMRKSEGEVLRN